MNVHIREAQRQDAAALANLLKSLGWFEHLASEAIEVSQKRVAHHLALCSADESHSVYVAVAQGRGCSRLMLVNRRDRDSYRRRFYERQGWQEREQIANFVYGLKLSSDRTY